MQRAEAQDQIHGVNAHDGAVLEQLAQNAERHAVVRVVEGGDDDGGVADVKIRVAGGQPHFVEEERRWHGQFHDFGLAAVFEAQVLDALPVFGERLVIDVARIFFADEHEGFGVHETADVVNVAVGVVADGAVEEPQDIFHAEIFFEGVVVLRPGHAGVADLDFWMQITFLGGEQRAAPVQLDAAAFNHKIAECGVRSAE